jgi:hypothetical protein
MQRIPLCTVVLAVTLCLGGNAFGADSLVTGPRTAAGLQVKIVQADLSQYALKVGLAQNRVGLTESLAGIAKRLGAVAAINGSFFDAYGKKSLRNPYQTLIVDGKIVHRGDVGSLLGVWPDGQARIAKLNTRLLGGLDRCYTWPDNWFSYWLNRLPEDPTAVIIYTPKYGAAKTPAGGTQITVRDNQITKIESGSQPIPADGYVIYISGQEASLAKRFKVGRRCDYRVCFNAADKSTGWEKVTEGMGGYPQLLGSGEVLVDNSSVTRGLASEGSNRSAVGLKPGGNVLFVTSGPTTLLKLATAMKSLGCMDALNLDGGASSGLYAKGAYLTKPGRDMPSALLLTKK